jgi:CubicO group peptidase (beta-lactamase class C family)
MNKNLLLLNKSLLLCGFLALGLLAGCSTLSKNVVSPDPVVLDQALGNDRNLRALADKLALPEIENGHDIGIVIGILDKDGTSQAFGYGRKSLDSAEAPDGDTVFAVGSITKSFNTLLLHALENEGKLREKETVGEILPEQSEFSFAAKHITLSELASHTSGLPRQQNSWSMLTSLVNYQFTGENIYRHVNQTEIYDYLREFQQEDGSVGTYRYSNIGMALLGHLIEKKTGQTLPTLLQEKLFEPLGLNHTSYEIAIGNSANVAKGYVGDSPLLLPRNHPVDEWKIDSVMRGTAGIYSTANDLLKLARYRMSIRDIPVVRTLVYKGSLIAPDYGDYKAQALGWEVNDFDGDQIRILYQRGMIAGYSAYVGINPDQGTAVVVLYNNFNWDDVIGHNLLLTLSRNAKSKRNVANDDSP